MTWLCLNSNNCAPKSPNLLFAIISTLNKITCSPLGIKVVLQGQGILDICCSKKFPNMKFLIINRNRLFI